MERDRKILDAAAAVFYERGFHGASMDELGARAGMTGPAIYRHFGGKNELLATLFDEAMDELLSATAAVYDDPQQDLERLIRHHVGFAVTRQHMVNVYQHEDRSLVEPWKKRFDRRRKQYVGRWEDAVRRCYPSADPAALTAATQAVLGMIFSVAFWPPRVARGGNVADVVVGLAREGLQSLAA